MRARMNQIIHTNRARQTKRVEIKNEPQNLDLQKQFEDLTETLLRLMAEELIDINRDVIDARNKANRAGKMFR